MTKELTTTEAGKILGIKTRSVAANIRKGYIKATKRGRDYFIKELDLKPAMNLKPGRKKG